MNFKVPARRPRSGSFKALRNDSYQSSLNNLAVLYESQGEYAKALPLYEECLKKRRSVLGVNHPDTLSSLNNLAGLYERQGDYAEALLLYEECLEKRRSLLAAYHPDVLTSLSDLAGFYESQGEYAKALLLYEECLEKRRSIFGENHLHTLTSLNNLAGFYESQGEYAKALLLYEECLEKRRSIFGEDHADTLTSLKNLAVFYESQGEYAKALSYEREYQGYLQDHRISMQKRLTEAENAQFPSESIDLSGSAVHKICRDKGISFIDLSFPPLQQSIFQAAQWAELTKERKKELDEIEWTRSAFVYPTSKDDYMLINHVFENDIEAADILQGGLFGCWFLSSLAALAEYPRLVEALFLPCSREYNESGVYFVLFCKNGLWTSVRVDDYIPCFPASGPVFSKSRGNEIWVLLVEKAYAKLHGSYLGIQSGKSYEALMDLTGAPYRIIEFPETFATENPATLDSIWNRLVDELSNHYIMSANTRTIDNMLPRKFTGNTGEPGSEGKAISFHHHGHGIQVSGLVSNHSYTVLALKQTRTATRLVKLRLE
jgi:tetratricopeptide (TPR) repeat protein